MIEQALLMTGITTGDWLPKNLLFSAWIGTMSAALVPVLNAHSTPMIEQALLMTGITTGSLGLIAYNAPSKSFLNLGGALSVALSGLIGVDLLTLAIPSP